MARETNPFENLPPQAIPPVDDAAEQARREAAGQAAGGADLSGLADVAADVGQAAFNGADLLASAADVGGEVVGGALEAVGGLGDALSGCGGCSLAVALVIVLATAGVALAW